MKGKLRRSMSDTEGRVGGTPSTRPPASTRGQASLQGRPGPGSPAKLIGWVTLDFLYRICLPTEGALLPLGKAVRICVVEARSGPAVSFGEGVLESSLTPYT